MKIVNNKVKYSILERYKIYKNWYTLLNDISKLMYVISPVENNTDKNKEKIINVFIDSYLETKSYFKDYSKLSKYLNDSQIKSIIKKQNKYILWV